MHISEQWLREWVDVDCDTQQLTEQLTMAGLEVEGIEPAAAEFSGVITAKVESVEKHPDADKLKICQVATGTGKSLKIVCGAANVRAGLYVALAPVGAELPGDITIKASELKGVLSEGMLCSAQELGLAEESDGLMELPDNLALGEELRDVLSLDDQIIELSLTPNRGDCLSISGVARELAVINDSEFKPQQSKAPEQKSEQSREVVINEAAACPRYVGQVIEDVDVSKPTPLWLTEKLRRCGLRSINPVVDITNFVMLEVGQPLHAFDNDKLQGSICVKYAGAGEKLELLDGQECELTADTLTIADDTGALAMAGIMGGQASAVVAKTNNIFLESAFFDPHAILGKARKYGLHTDSSHRFERGVDFEIQKQAIDRAAKLIIDLCGGRPGPVIEKLSGDDLPELKQVSLRRGQIERLLGISLADEDILGIFSRLGMQIEVNDEGWLVTAPSFRFDIEIEADLIEEIARIYGYNNIKRQLPLAHLQMHKDNELQIHIKKMRQLLVDRGYQEAITYSFVDAKTLEILNPGIEALPLANPIASELSVMRTSLLPGLVGALLYNQKRQQARIRLFETGLIFKNDKKLSQTPAIAGIITGNINENQWDIKDRSCDLFDLKKDIEALFELNGYKIDVNFSPIHHSALHPGQSAKIVHDNQELGFIGALHPSVQKKLGLTKEAFVFEIELENISKHITANYQKISKFPSVQRDISIMVAEETSIAEIMDLIGKTTPDVLYNLELFDVYRGEAIDLGKKSLALGLTFQRTSSTLTDDEVESAVGSILEGLRKEFGASLRE
ncbi:MAG: phenylalanine--tRNA ligase subunit beta [Gammaproteobacteria bacterium]|nr:MAG: phenylalanine--tRNA ligase subunit beta [Gammaproteobacteria bacterium]